MPRIPPGDGGGGGGGGSIAPTPAQQAIAARRLRGDVGLAEERVQVVAPSGELLTPAPLRFSGAGVQSVGYDDIDRLTVVTIPGSVLFGTAAARPASPVVPCLYIATDTGEHSSWDGASWRVI